MAASTERITLGTNVTKLPRRHPLLMAKTVGSAAALFSGRIGLGVGLSWIRRSSRGWTRTCPPGAPASMSRSRTAHLHVGDEGGWFATAVIVRAGA
ncbi:MAG: LLM class flavin-dependent oxidoreductase [Iamia sp.]